VTRKTGYRSREESQRNLASKVCSPAREASKQNTTTCESIDQQNMSDTEQADASPAAPVQVITATRNLKSQPFIPGGDPTAKGKVWDNWLEEIEWEFRYFKIMEPLDKKDALIIYGGKEIARLEKSLPNLTDGNNDYKKLKKKLNDNLKPKKNKHHARYVFLKMRPAHDETTNACAARLR